MYIWRKRDLQQIIWLVCWCILVCVCVCETTLRRTRDFVCVFFLANHCRYDHCHLFFPVYFLFFFLVILKYEKKIIYIQRKKKWNKKALNDQTLNLYMDCSFFFSLEWIKFCLGWLSGVVISIRVVQSTNQPTNQCEWVQSSSFLPSLIFIDEVHFIIPSLIIFENKYLMTLVSHDDDDDDDGD